jgi:hypothetical protein
LAGFASLRLVSCWPTNCTHDSAGKRGICDDGAGVEFRGEIISQIRGRAVAAQSNFDDRPCSPELCPKTDDARVRKDRRLDRRRLRRAAEFRVPDGARAMAAALCRKRPSPLASGQPRTWACGIVYVLGRINFLDDPSFAPHMTTAQLCAGFGVGESTVHAKARVIEKAVGTKRHAIWSKHVESACCLPTGGWRLARNED